jgi:hypothetical protein
MANLRYQQLQIQQTEKGVLTSEKQQRSYCYCSVIISGTCFAFDFPSPQPSH